MALAWGGRGKLMSIAIGCFSVILLIVGISGIIAVWAGLSYRSLGTPTSDAATLAIVVGDAAARPAGAVSPPAASDTAAAPLREPLSPPFLPLNSPAPVAVRHLSGSTSPFPRASSRSSLDHRGAISPWKAATPPITTNCWRNAAKARTAWRSRCAWNRRPGCSPA